MKGMATCKVCGRDFALMEEEHYVARDVFGIKTWDAFDCPHCGCQYAAQERRLSVATEDKEDVPEFTSCDECKYADKPIGVAPCANCVHAIVGGIENFEPKEDK